ncbi:acyltransferase [Enterobacteriaceae bacterium LUAb1]
MTGQNNTIRERDFIIDLFRFTGLSLIILAHVFPPDWLFQIRTFDVPLMVFVSGMAFCISGNSKSNITQYLFSRFKRMVLPAWAFITLLYFVIFPLTENIFADINNYHQMLSSYQLKGFGYFWVIRVFLLISLFSGCYKFLIKTLSPLTLFFCFLLTETGLTLAWLYFPSFFNKANLSGKVMWEIVFPVISYGILFCLGYLFKFGRKDIYGYAAFSLLLLTGLEIGSISQNQGAILLPQDFKYPPTLFYISWGIFACAILCFLASKSGLEKVKDNTGKRIICFISSNTIWIYFWHIPLAEYFRRTAMTDIVAIKYLVTYLLPVMIVFAQTLLVKWLTRSRFTRFNRLIKTVFTG